jgi:predicted RNA-binding protein
MAFAGTVTVTSSVYEDHQPIWRTGRRDDDYPWRVHIRPDIVLEESEWIAAKELAYRLEYVRKWPPEHWTLAFQGQLHQLAQKDFKLIEDELARVQEKRRLAG